MPATPAQRVRAALIQMHKSGLPALARNTDSLLKPATQNTQSVPVVFYHGTTTKQLRSIMVNGLDPSKIKDGNWVEDSHVDHINPSKKSYGGIYYSKDASKAMSYADDLARKQNNKYDCLLVCVQLSEQGTVHDEDDYGFVRMIFSGITNDNHSYSIAQKLTEIILQYENDYYGNKYSYKNILTKFREQILDFMQLSGKIDKRRDKAKLLHVIDGLFIAEAKRYLAHLNEKNGYSSWSSGQTLMTKHFHSIAPKSLRDKYTTENEKGYTTQTVPKKFILPTPERAERDFRRALNTFIMMTHDYKPDKSDFFKQRRTLRLITAVGFKGKNKIIGIISYKPYIYGEPRDYTMKVLYGKVPSTFLPSYKSAIGDTSKLVWQDRSGKDIGKGNEVPQMTVAYDTDEPYTPEGGVDVDDTVNGPEQSLVLQNMQDAEDAKQDELEAKQAAEQKAQQPPQEDADQSDEGQEENDSGDDGDDDDEDDDSSDSDDGEQEDDSDEDEEPDEPQKNPPAKKPTKPANKQKEESFVSLLSRVGLL